MNPAKKSKKKDKSTKKHSRWWHRPMLIGLRLLPWIIVTASLALSLRMGARAAWSGITGDERFAVKPENTYFQKPDTVRKDEMEREFREKLEDVLAGTHIFDRALPERVGEVLMGTAWVTDINEVRRLLPNKLKCTVEFREPAGRVLIDNQPHLIDRDGYWLPKDLYRSPAEWTETAPPAIVQDDISDFPRRGRRWPGKRLTVGARFSGFLMESGMMDVLPVKEINVTNVGAEMRGRNIVDVTLRLENGAVIGWGTTDDYHDLKGLDRRGAEPSDEEKMYELRGFLHEYPGLRGIEFLDLRFNKITYVLGDDD